MELQICDASERHIPQIEALERVCFSVPWTAEQIRSQLTDAQHVFLTALDTSDRVLGYVGMMTVLDEGYIANVAVAPSYRRKGIADRLIARLDEIAQARGLAFMTLEVRSGNAPAIALYAKHRFVPVGLRKNYCSLPREDALLMTKSIGNEAKSFEDTRI